MIYCENLIANKLINSIFDDIINSKSIYDLENIKQK